MQDMRISEIDQDAEALLDALTLGVQVREISLTTADLDVTDLVTKIHADAYSINFEYETDPLDIPKGWCALASCTLAALRLLSKRASPQYLPLWRAKEKSGELRVVLGAVDHDDAVMKIADSISRWAQDRSRRCCAVSGEPAVMLSEHMIVPLHPRFHDLYHHDRPALRRAMRLSAALS